MDKLTRYLLISITAGFLLLTIAKSFYLSNKYGGSDLRARVVGSRLLGTGHSPYFYKWNPADGEFFLDPNDEAFRPVNGNVATPATLMLIYPLCQLPYKQVHLLWTVFETLAALVTIWLLFKKKNITTTLLAASPVILGLLCSNVWLFHIDRGQMYIFYALLLAVIYRLYISNLRYNQFLSGLVAGLFIFLRPFAAIFGLGFLLAGKKQWVAGCAAGCMLGVLVFVLPGIQLWKDYFKAMPEYISQEMGTGINTRAPEPIKPAVIEGANNITQYATYKVGRMENAYQFLRRFNISVTVNQSLIWFAILTGVFSVWFFKTRKKMADPDALFLFGSLLLLLSEIFIPAQRGAYNIIVWMFPLSLIFLRAGTNLPVLIGLAISLLLVHGFPFAFGHEGELAEMLFVLLTIFTIFFPELFKNLSNGISRTGPGT